MDETKNTMRSLVITNEMLYELLKEFKVDVNRRFDDIYKRFDDVYKRFDDLFDFIKSERHAREKMQNKLDEIYECRNAVTIRFTRSWIFASFFIAFFAAIMILAIDKAF